MEVSDDQIIAALRLEYGLQVVRLARLPLGADRNTLVYRADTVEGPAHFVKVRRGAFEEASVTLPRLLSDQGIEQIIAPVATHSGKLWASVGALKVLLYPFVAGRSGLEVGLSERQWRDLGAALKRIHTTEAPPPIARGLSQETYSRRWREITRGFLERPAGSDPDDPCAAELAAFLKARKADIVHLVDRAERLAVSLQDRSPALSLCHSDVHAGNILIDAEDKLYIVDWDNPILAPKERDLMFFGGGQGFVGRTPREEETLFYQGYGQTRIDPIALAYYRYERIIEDIAVNCQQLLSTNEGAESRARWLGYLKSNFLPGGTLEIACASDQ